LSYPTLWGGFTLSKIIFVASYPTPLFQENGTGLIKVAINGNSKIFL